MSLFEDTAWDPKNRGRFGTAGMMFVGVSIAIWGGCRDFKASWYSDAEPNSLTAAQLATDGPGDNLHVVITDYRVSQERSDTDKASWFLIFPHQRQNDAASLAVKSQRAEMFFRPDLPSDHLQGLVYDASGDLTVDQRYALKRLGPVDFDKLWVIEHNQLPPPWWKFLLKVGGGLALAGLGLAIILMIGTDD